MSRWGWIAREGNRHRRLGMFRAALHAKASMYFTAHNWFILRWTNNDETMDPSPGIFHITDTDKTTRIALQD